MIKWIANRLIPKKRLSKELIVESGNFWLFLGAGAVFFGAILVYVLFMIFLPEWVGITGKVALEAERSHREGAAATEEDIISKMHNKRSDKTSGESE